MDQSTAVLFTNFVSSLDWSAWVTATATLFLAVLTFIYVILTRKILSAQSDPCVILTVVHDEERSTILQLVAKNIGTGLALDVRFEFSQPIPANAFGVAAGNSEKAEIMKDGPLIYGIPALGPGESRKIDWGQFGGLTDVIGDEKIVATCRFKKNDKEMTPTKCPLDVNSFSGTSAVASLAEESARDLKKISTELKLLGSGFHKLRVEVTSMPKDEAGSDE